MCSHPFFPTKESMSLVVGLALNTLNNMVGILLNSIKTYMSFIGVASTIKQQSFNPNEVSPHNSLHGK